MQHPRQGTSKHNRTRGHPRGNLCYSVLVSKAHRGKPVFRAASLRCPHRAPRPTHHPPPCVVASRGDKLLLGVMPGDEEASQSDTSNLFPCQQPFLTQTNAIPPADIIIIKEKQAPSYRFIIPRVIRCPEPCGAENGTRRERTREFWGPGIVQTALVDFKRSAFRAESKSDRLGEKLILFSFTALLCHCTIQVEQCGAGQRAKKPIRLNPPSAGW